MSGLIRQFDHSDPGDETLRNFRYQFGYGAILLLAALRSEKDYVSMWCEHFEDMVCERVDGLFDCYQIKTSTPENGHLRLTTDSVRKSIKRFVALQSRFGDDIATMFIVSNTEFLDTEQADKITACPGRLLGAIRAAAKVDGIDTVFMQAFNALKNYCECDADSLFTTLKKVDLCVGPSRQSFETDIAHTHVPRVKGCENCTPNTLSAIVDDLVGKVFRASSLKIGDPDVHLHTYFSRTEIDPRLLGKRIFIEEADSIIKKHTASHFRYVQGSGSLVVADGNRDLTKLAKKLSKGGLDDYIATMQRKALATEKRLLEAPPEKLSDLIDQLESVVQGECDEAHLEAKYDDRPTGEIMLRTVHKRLRTIAEQRPADVFGEPYDTLVGFAGLLTSDCKVWWSEKFDINL
ncbi:dsDNA nuclease domain-containing protein [Rudanella lutea]|uniref:dsDNA nuclease domain-containing protein n=1 Tax=Rudanella lutea TaxID=451374 RepID=UPI00037241E6|nr:dsDNA nuclease domain-containing protein [Rudanella lutea]